MSIIKLIITIVIVFLLIGCFVISPKQSIIFVKETTKAFFKFIIVLFKEGKDLVADVMEKIGKEKKQ